MLRSICILILYHDITALSEFAPNVNLTPQNGFNAIAGGMRGTGFISILVTKDPSVGVSVDEFAFNHVQSQFVELFDIEQIELFRGPQGTLFGKNTTGGAIAITTKKPVLGEFFGRDNGNARTTIFDRVQVVALGIGDIGRHRHAPRRRRPPGGAAAQAARRRSAAADRPPQTTPWPHHGVRRGQRCRPRHP